MCCIGRRRTRDPIAAVQEGFRAEVASVLETPWTMSTSADLAFPQTRGDRRTARHRRPRRATRERFVMPLPTPYVDAFAGVDADPRNLLVVGEVDGVVVATMQMTFIPNITFVGGERALVEGVRVAASVQRHGVGAARCGGASTRRAGATVASSS